MWNRLRPYLYGPVSLLGGLALAGCASDPTMVAPAMSSGYKDLGPAKGSACGSMLILSPAYNFIPAGLNSRVERAYSEAVHSVPEATALINVNMEEDWYWYLFGTARCVTITGEAVK